MMITKKRRFKTVVFFCFVCGLLLSNTTQAQPDFQYVYDEIGQLKKAIDKEGNVLEYVYDEVGNILEIKRYTISELAILDFNPKQGPVGTKVTIQGRGFNSSPLDNTLEFNGTPATVDTATDIQLETTVPPGATTGLLSVTVASATASSADNFMVVGVPEILSIKPSVGLFGQLIPDFTVTGKALLNSEFKFVGDINPPKAVTSSIINKQGTLATMTVTVDPSTRGIYVVQASNGTGSSSNVPGPGNTFQVVDPDGDEDNDGLSNQDEITNNTELFNPDTDGDGVSDGEEVRAGSNPREATSLPFNPDQTSAEVTSQIWSVLNTLNPGQPGPGQPSDPALFVGEANSESFSILNAADPGKPGPGGASDPALFVGEANSESFSILNAADPGQPGPGEANDPALFVGEAISSTFSVMSP